MSLPYAVFEPESGKILRSGPNGYPQSGHCVPVVAQDALHWIDNKVVGQILGEGLAERNWQRCVCDKQDSTAELVGVNENGCLAIDLADCGEALIEGIPPWSRLHVAGSPPLDLPDGADSHLLPLGGAGDYTIQVISARHLTVTWRLQVHSAEVTSLMRISDLNSLAESIRSDWLTPGSAKGVEYARKAQEAAECIRTGSAEGLHYVQAEARRQGVTDIEAAQWIDQRARETAVAGVEIDDVVKRGVAALRAADRHAAAEAVFEEHKAALLALRKEA